MNENLMTRKTAGSFETRPLFFIKEVICTLDPLFNTYWNNACAFEHSSSKKLYLSAYARASPQRSNADQKGYHPVKGLCFFGVQRRRVTWKCPWYAPHQIAWTADKCGADCGRRWQVCFGFTTIRNFLRLGYNIGTLTTAITTASTYFATTATSIRLYHACVSKWVTLCVVVEKIARQRSTRKIRQDVTSQLPKTTWNEAPDLATTLTANQNSKVRCFLVNFI